MTSRFPIMFFTVSVFKELVERFPEWDALRAFLESEEGGQLRIVDQSAEDSLVLIRYEKGVSCMNVPHVGWFRSVIWDTQRNRPVSVAPQRSSSLPIQRPLPQSGEEEGWVCEEFLDGFMIQCFRKVEAGAETQSSLLPIHIATRSKINASGTFYSSKTFRELFLEAYGDGRDLSAEIVPFDVADTAAAIAVSYSFLVQHAENRIVSPVTSPRAVLVQRVAVMPCGSIIVEDHLPHITRIPGILTGEGTLEERLNALFSSMQWSFQGVVIKDELGNRWKFRSYKYMQVKSLRGNYPDTLNRYAYLYTQNLIETYLTYYPEDAFSFSFQSVCLQQIVAQLHRIYVEIHVRKQLALDAVDKMYHPHLYHLHRIFLNKLRSAGRHLTETDIHQYFHGQPWQRIAFLIRKTQDSYFSQVQDAMEVAP